MDDDDDDEGQGYVPTSMYIGTCHVCIRYFTPKKETSTENFICFFIQCHLFSGIMDILR